MQTKSEMISRIAELAQENAELKGKLDAYKQSEQEANEIIAELKAENERLKEKVKDKSCPFFFKHTAFCLGRKDEMSRYDFCKSHTNCNIKQMVKDIDKYKQALAEIKEIAKRDCGNCPYNQNCDYIFQECEESKIDDILQKISEVTNG